MRLEPGAWLAGEALKVFRRGSIATMTPEDIKRARRRGISRTPVTEPFIGRLHPAVALADLVLATTAGYLPIRTYRPRRASAEALPMVVHFHGGGWVLGDLDMGDWLCSQVAAEVGAVVVSVDYCLAPEHPFPAAVEECLAAVTALAANAGDHGGDPSRIAVMGDSAGGNLAAVIAQQARDAGPRITAQVLLYPATDATFASPSIDEHANAIVLTRADMEAFVRHYLGDADPTDPRVSPLLTDDLAGLPPALIQTAEHDPLRDDGARYAEALRTAGVEVRYTEYLGTPHGYINMPGLTRASKQALAEIVAELRRRLHTG